MEKAPIVGKKRDWTKLDAITRECISSNCDPEKNQAAAFQANKYGKKNRTMNPTKNGWSCTACGHNYSA